MRLLFPFIFLFVFDCYAQRIAYVTDTKTVGISIIGADTSHYIKDLYSITENWIIYYDTTQSRIAKSITFYSKNRYDEKSWYSDGKPKAFSLNNDSTPYYQKDGARWFPSGQLQSEHYATRDSSNGKSWWVNGQISTESKRWGGIPWNPKLGESKWYHPNGVMYRHAWSCGDSVIAHSLHANGAVSTITKTYPDTSKPFGVSCHYMHSFHDNGKEASTELHPNLGRQPITYFYPSGAIKEKGDWYEGRIGPYKEWYESGKIKSEGNYSVGIIYFPNHNSYNYYPTKTGHWIYYSEAGWIEKEEWREFDGVVTVKEYNEKSEVIKEYQNQVRIDAKEFPEKYRK